MAISTKVHNLGAGNVFKKKAILRKNGVFRQVAIKDVGVDGSFLPAIDIAIISWGLPIHANLQPIYDRGLEEARDIEGFGIRNEAHRALPPLGRQRL